jgi:hypothetical protein
MKHSMRTELPDMVSVNRLGEPATHPLKHLVARLPLSLLVAGTGLLPRRFAASTRPDASSDAFIYGF